MGLHIHHGPHLLPLVEGLATLLADPLDDPFTAEVVAVPTAGVRDWLQQELGLRLGAGPARDGIAANIEMVFPGRFNAAALGRPLDSSSAWDIERLTWTVLQALEAGDVHVPGWHGAGAGRVHRPGTYSSARRIADLFDRYAINRPQLLQQWFVGRDGDGTVDDHDAVVPLSSDHAWQPRLWRRVRAMIDQPNPAEQMPRLLGDLRNGLVEPQLPARVAVFGVSGMSTAQLAIVQALGAVREVHVYIVHPSTAAWAAAPQRLAGRLTLRSACDATVNVAHPLLRSWARPAMETAVLVAGLDAGITADEPAAVRSAPAVTSLLAQVQRDLVADAVPGATEWQQSDRRDTSVQVHACHGTVRQLEVLRDALGHVFAADASLTAHDVVVLCPDLGRFAPLVQSVFQRSALPVPVRVTDLSLGTGNPVASALTAVLDVVGGRCTGPEVLGLCSLDPVRHAFQFDDEAIERIDRWINELGISWGLDGEHRNRWIADDIAEGTWASALDRVLVGAAMPAPVPRVGPSGIVPFDDIDAAALVTAGRLGDILDHLGRLRRTTADLHTIDEWIVVLTEVVTSLLATPAADEWQTIQVMETIADIGRHAAGATEGIDRADGPGPSTVLLALNDVRALLAGVLDQQRGRLNLRSGAVTVTAMVPVRNIPARVVCMLGLDEGTLRASSGDGDDVLAARPCVGERDPRAEGRHLLLDALTSAGDHFIVTCDGSDITTNRPLPLPVLIEELLDTVRATAPGLDVVTRHPRQAFDERNFGAGAHGEPVGSFSFDDGMLAAAETRRIATAGTREQPVLDAVVPLAVTVAQLAEAPTRPARTFLEQRLDVRLPRPVEEIDVDIPLMLGNLSSWQLARELLDHHRRGAGDAAVQQWRDATRRSGRLPPRALADAVIGEIERELGVLLDAKPDLRHLITVGDTIDVALSFPVASGSVGATQVRLDHVVEHVADELVVRVEYTRPKNRLQVELALELALLVATQPERDWHGLLVTRGSGSTTKTVVELQPVQGDGRVDAAHRLLQTTLELHLRALREPIPMFDRSSRALFETHNFEQDEFDADLRDNHTAFVWGDATPDEVLAMPRRQHDELTGVAQTAGGGRADAFAAYFWSAFEAFVPTQADR